MSVVLILLKLSWFSRKVAFASVAPSSSSSFVSCPPLCVYGHAIPLEAQLTHRTPPPSQTIRLLCCRVPCYHKDVCGASSTSLPSPSFVFPPSYSSTQPAPCSTRNPTHRTPSPVHPTQSNMVLFGGRVGGGRSTGVASTPAAPAPRYVLPLLVPSCLPRRSSRHHLRPSCTR
jgi:hypothetical protein